eukprot:scaffold357463_cov27-Prasinocladus_malaysianus.AAC.1
MARSHLSQSAWVLASRYDFGSIQRELGRLVVVVVFVVVLVVVLAVVAVGVSVPVSVVRLS